MAQRLRFDIRQAGKQFLIVFAVLAALNLGFYLFFTRPTVQKYQGLLDTEAGHEQLEERREQVAEREAFLTGLQKAEADLRQIRDEILSTRTQRLVDVQEEVARLAKEFRINLDSVNYTNEQLVNEELDRMAMTIPLEGGYAALRRFLQAVEDSDKFLLVERVALAKGKRGGVMLQLNITLATYYNAPADLIERKNRLLRRRA